MTTPAGIGTDVRFDPAAAEAAAAACEAAARRLDDARSARATTAATTRDGWEGPHRATFDDHIAQLDRASQTLAAELRTLATEMRAAILTAAREQQALDARRGAGGPAGPRIA
ncbi:MAG: WXG100 family type VII secretion target [Actinobacteria bacterium]|nr:WXG100 family type VII secretion target [Actinomycetota bacterium]